MANDKPVEVTVKPFGPLPSDTEQQQPEAKKGPLSYLFQPFTSWPDEYKKLRGEAQEQVGTGLSELGKGQVGKGLWDTGFGAASFVGSPIEAGLNTVVGKPLEQNLGIPSQYSTFAAGLAIPYYGLKGGAGGDTAFRRAFSPEKITGGDQAAAAIREFGGEGRRATEQAKATMTDDLHRTVNQMTPVERQGLVDYMEGTQAGPLPQQVQKIADAMRDIFERRKIELQNLGSTATMNFIEDYFPHMWQDPRAAQNFAREWAGVAKQGSGASLKARTMPTIQDGLNAGLKLAVDDPIKVMERYVTSMDRFIASTKVLETGEAQGTVIRARPPQAMGASGNPAGVPKVPPGYAALKGRGAVDASGRQAYAPEAWARIYNNFIDRGFAGHPLYEAGRAAFNGITALELTMSGYHFLTMAQEGMVNELARAIQEGAAGKPKAARTLLGAPFAPITLPIRGRRGERIYLGLTQGSAKDRELVDLLTKAGAAMTGKRHAFDVYDSGMGSFWKSFKRGSLKIDAMKDIDLIRQGVSPTQKAVAAAKVAGRNVGRLMDTIMAPLFETYIPKLKNGAAMQNLASWLERHPNATQPEKLQAAREIWDSIDNRFGEMVHDNIFWAQWQKQMATLGMRSFSWNLGTVREIGGGLQDAAKGELSQRAAYNVALPIVYATLGALYQKFKTNEWPQDFQDALAPRTGGTDAGTGKSERVVPPGYMKDIIGWSTDPRQEAANKVGTGPKLIGDLFSGKDWRNDPITGPNDDMAAVMRAYFAHTVDSMGPISMRNVAKGPRRGTNLSQFEQWMGMQPTGMKLTDPEGFSRMMRYKDMQAERLKQRHQKREEQRYGGPEE